jgi:hypothetical protein
MLSSDWTPEADLDYAARVCACPNCKRLAAFAADSLRAKLAFARAYEALRNAAVLRSSGEPARPE